MSYWKICTILFLMAILGAGIFYYATKPSYPAVVNIYQWRYNQMQEPERIQALTDYTKSINDSIERLNYSELLAWEHRHLTYTKDYLVSPRPELPIPIIERGQGRCGEFALLYTGLCLANNIPVRLVIDCSAKTDNRTAGDHVWNQVYISGEWITVDPTENKVNQPYLYRDQWNKNVNLVYAIDESGIIDVTDRYA